MSGVHLPIPLLELRNLRLLLGRSATPSTVQLLCDTIWGTPGGMRYQHFGTAEKITQLVDPWFLYLEKDSETLGVLCLDRRPIGELNTFYIRYFSFAEGMRSKRTVKSENEAVVSRGQGIFKRYSTAFFEQPTALLQAAESEKAVFYAFVELENARSRDMVAQMGLSVCGQFSTLIFSRVLSRKHQGVRRSRVDERDYLRSKIESMYADHAFYSGHGLFYKDNYFVIEVDGKVVAGAQAHDIRWRIVEIPGFSGKLMMKVLPWMPLANRLMNPSAFRFAAIEGLFFEPGFESSIEPLLEGILSELGLNTALLWLGNGTKVDRAIRTHVRLGLLQRFKQDVPATVVMRAYGYSAQELEVLQGRPVYISAFDAT